MILRRTNPLPQYPLSEFGIEIPAAPGRTERILDALRGDPELRAREAEWLIGADGSVLDRDDLVRAHSSKYVDTLFSDDVVNVLAAIYEIIDEKGGYHRYNPANAKHPLAELFDRSLFGPAGTYQCCKEAMARGFCFSFSGGGHHAHREFGHGFCILNDIVIALRKMQAEDRIRTAWIIDVDAHKGDGVAAMTAGDPTIVTLSVHMAHGWPLDLPAILPDGTPHPSFIPSDIDVPVEAGDEARYNEALRAALRDLDRYPRPDLALVELGADPYEHDELPSASLLKLSLEQMTERNLLIYRFLEERKIPGAYLMSGGYGERAWEPYPPFLETVLRERLAPIAPRRQREA